MGGGAPARWVLGSPFHKITFIKACLYKGGWCACLAGARCTPSYKLFYNEEDPEMGRWRGGGGRRALGAPPLQISSSLTKEDKDRGRGVEGGAPASRVLGPPFHLSSFIKKMIYRGLGVRGSGACQAGARSPFSEKLFYKDVAV